MGAGASHLQFSQNGSKGLSFGNRVEVYQDPTVHALTHPYMKTVTSLQFRPYARPTPRCAPKLQILHQQDGVVLHQPSLPTAVLKALVCNLEVDLNPGFVIYAWIFLRITVEG